MSDNTDNQHKKQATVSNYGFVYVLGNECMPDIIKIGCTERSPTARAEELSKPSGVPTPFRVLCFAEFEDFQAVEQHMHEWCKHSRVANNREFFRDCLRRAVSLLWYHPHRLSFCDATANDRWPGDSELVAMVCTERFEGFLDDLSNPFASAAENEARLARRKRIAEGDFSDFDDPIHVVEELMLDNKSADGPTAIGAQGPI